MKMLNSKVVTQKYKMGISNDTAYVLLGVLVATGTVRNAVRTVHYEYFHKMMTILEIK